MCIADDLVERLRNANPDLMVGEPTEQPRRSRPARRSARRGRVTLPVTTGGQDLELFTDFVFVRVSRGVALLLLVDALSPFDEDMRADLTSKVTRRLAAELG